MGWEMFLWIIFNVLLPGFPFFLALFLDHFMETKDLNENISIVVQSDILILGASLATGVFEGFFSDDYKLGKIGLLLSVLSLLFFLGLFFILYVPNIGYALHFRSEELESKFWMIMKIGCLINIVLGIFGDVLLKNRK